jgi:hypothetical protein
VSEEGIDQEKADSPHEIAFLDSKEHAGQS